MISYKALIISYQWFTNEYNKSSLEQDGQIITDSLYPRYYYNNA